MRVANIDLIDGTPVALNANRNLEKIMVSNIFYASIQLVVSATVNGTFKLQVSNDSADNQLYGQSGSTRLTPTNWDDYPNSSISVSAAGLVTYNIADIGFTWMRVVFTDASGGTSSGSITSARASLKGA
jgi:hypothetical protein